jgi:hypothetical protein
MVQTFRLNFTDNEIFMVFLPSSEVFFGVLFISILCRNRLVRKLKKKE